MLSINLIQRHLDARQFDRLLQGLSDNGLDLPLPLLVRLAQTSACAAAVALRRVLELTYGPTSLSRQLTQFILDGQHADGSFGPDDVADPLATACAVAALDRLEDQPGEPDPRAAAAVERALATFARTQHDDGLLSSRDDRSTEDRALVSAWVLWLLAGHDGFRQSVRYADLLNWFADHSDVLEPATERLWHMASLDAPVDRRPSPALAAIAA